MKQKNPAELLGYFKNRYSKDDFEMTNNVLMCVSYDFQMISDDFWNGI